MFTVKSDEQNEPTDDYRNPRASDDFRSVRISVHLLELSKPSSTILASFAVGSETKGSGQGFAGSNSHFVQRPEPIHDERVLCFIKSACLRKIVRDIHCAASQHVSSKCVGPFGYGRGSKKGDTPVRGSFVSQFHPCTPQPALNLDSRWDPTTYSKPA